MDGKKCQANHSANVLSDSLREVKKTATNGRFRNDLSSSVQAATSKSNGSQVGDVRIGQFRNRQFHEPPASPARSLSFLRHRNGQWNDAADR